MSVTTACRVRALMLTVPGQVPCSWLHAMVTGGSGRTGYAAAIYRTMTQAMAVSVISDREAEECRALLGACALGAGALPADLHQSLTAALRMSERVIRRSLV
jgi:hypothetical protein